MAKVLVGMSGGVDSSVAAKVLKDSGYDVTGVTLKMFASEDIIETQTRTCCSLSDVEDARAVADLIEEKFTKMNGKVQIYSIGATIGSHTGPGTVALFFWGDERVR